MSVAIKGAEQNFTRLTTPVKYRIYTDGARVTPRGASCIIFNDRWSPENCQVSVRVTPAVVELNKIVSIYVNFALGIYKTICFYPDIDVY